MKKILFLSPLPPPHYGSAISSKTCLEILKNSKEFDVKNIKLNYSEDMEDVGKITLKKIRGIFKVRKEILNDLKIFNPNLIYFVPATSGLGLIRDFLFVKEIKKRNKEIILFHIRSRIIRNKLNNLIYKRMFKNSKAIVLGETLVNDVSEYISKEDILILPNAILNEISNEKFKKIEKLRKKRNSFNILFLSNMDRSKGWIKLLKSCVILKKENIQFNAFFVGEWASKKDEIFFKEFIKKNYLKNNVFYLGKKIGEEKKELLIKSDVLVFPTEYKLETFGRVILEGMMVGLPVIANSIASIPSIVKENDSGFLLKENSPEEIAFFLKKYANNKKLIIKQGKFGRYLFLKKFEIKNYNKKFVTLINSSFNPL